MKKAGYTALLILMAVAAAVMLYSGVTSNMGIATWISAAFLIGEGAIWFLKGFTPDTPLSKGFDKKIFKLLAMLSFVGIFLTIIRLTGF